MKEKYTKRTSDNNADFLISRGYSPAIADMIAARGVTEDNYDEYFGDKLLFHAPCEMSNMDEAVEMVRYCMENDGSVLICGDYDADGLSSSALLSLYFSDNGVFNKVLIPTRDEGYGLHADAVIKEFEKHFYDLVITVDCGISNADEVAKIKDELGVEVIVTDHHELPEILPDCICVNPKIGYPFAYLSGSGVAWKLVEALTDRNTAMKYVDLAIIGTIGDIMPMSDENRSIVKCGISNWNHKGLKKLAELSKCGDKLTCSDIAMRIVPKINAAGRVGNPYAALELLLMRDKADKATAEKLIELNDQRKEFLDDIIAEADNMIDARNVRAERIVYIVGNKWQHGLLGIAAARYKEKYYLPSVVMTDDGENYVGSARGIDGVDLFDAFRRCKDLLVKFGGHKASVGFTVAKQNVDNLRHALSDIFRNMDESLFVKTMYYDAEIGVDCTANDIYKLQNYLQPLLPQDKIVCRVRDNVQFANAFGKDGSHLTATLGSGLEVKGFFKYGAFASYMKQGTNVDLLCSVDLDSYTHNVCGIIEDMQLSNSVCFDDIYKINLVENCTVVPIKLTDETTAIKLVKKPSVCVVFDDYETYLYYSKRYDLQDFTVDVFFYGGGDRVVAVSPTNDYDFSAFDNVIYFGDVTMRRDLPQNAYYVQITPARKELYEIGLTREICMLCFSAIKHKDKFDSLKGVYDKMLLNKLTYPQFIAALRVFEELGFIKVTDRYTVEFFPEVKSELTKSDLYNRFRTKE